MARATSNFVCQQCGYESPRWLGKCPSCDSWGSLVETVVSAKSNSKNKSSTISLKDPTLLSSVKTSQKSRMLTNIFELDRVLGGGFVSGQVILLAGYPGIGKSTLLLQVANTSSSTLYVSGEESSIQVKLRADRLGVDNNKIFFLEITDVDAIVASLESIPAKNQPSLVIIDSIQTMTTSDLTGLAGSVGQVRECAFRLLQWAKRNNIPLIMVGHVTKEGGVAGPAVLSHIVDTVLWFEGDSTNAIRILRPLKNRFGTTEETGIFRMEEKGLVSLEEGFQLYETKDQKVSGTCISAISQGSRVMLVEIQTLVVPSKLANPRRVVQGMDSRKVELIIAVLARRCGLRILDSDVFVNVAGGMNIREPGADFALALALASSCLDVPLPSAFVAIGEIGLLGEVRPVSRQERRIKESKRLGMKKIVSSSDYSYLRDAVKKLSTRN